VAQLVLHTVATACDGAARKTMKTRGEKRWIQSHVYLIKDENDEICNVVMMHDDITERKQPEPDRQVEFGEFAEAVQQLGLYWLLLNEPPPPTGD